MTKRKKSNELEFQGALLGWLNDEIKRRFSGELDKATQEKPRASSGKRNDLVVWNNRQAESALIEIELKTPTTPITDPELLNDAIEKAQHWGAPYFAIWNMQEAEVYKTPAKGKSVTPADALRIWGADIAVRSVDDWLRADTAKSLRERALEILGTTWEYNSLGKPPDTVIDSSIFVERLRSAIDKVRTAMYGEIRKKSRSNRNFRKKLRKIAAEQGFIDFVDDIENAIAGQYGYRIIGQVLFYFALRRKQDRLKELVVSEKDAIPQALIPYWNDVRRYDYEALFAPHEIDKLVELPDYAQSAIRELITQFGTYDWSSLRDDVLGSVFESLIPSDEQHLLGQFYTPRPVADFLTAFAIEGDRPLVLDPGCGSGTFLLSAYEYMATRNDSSHSEILSTLWGFDLSPFAAELAAINLFRQDLAEYDNFPRIVPGDFFERRCGEKIKFPPPKSKGEEKISVPIPNFNTILGNPPYLRSQNQDDLDTAYKSRLFNTATRLGVHAAAKTDLFTFFIYHALEMMEEGARIGFVTPASWLMSNYAIPLQRLLLTKMRLVAIVASSAESFFTQVDVNTVLLVAEARGDEDEGEGHLVKFVRLKQALSNLFPHDAHYWGSLVDFCDKIEDLQESVETDDYQVLAVSEDEELTALDANTKVPRNWSIYLRAPMTYYKLIGKA